jgi:hypothetical protein
MRCPSRLTPAERLQVGRAQRFITHRAITRNMSRPRRIKRRRFSRFQLQLPTISNRRTNLRRANLTNRQRRTPARLRCACRSLRRVTATTLHPLIARRPTPGAMRRTAGLLAATAPLAQPMAQVVVRTLLPPRLIVRREPTVRRQPITPEQPLQRRRVIRLRLPRIILAGEVAEAAVTLAAEAAADHSHQPAIPEATAANQKPAP